VNNWHDLIGPLKQSEAFKKAYAFANEQRNLGLEVYPPKGQEFNAFVYTPLNKLKVVIIGQDPYHEPHQAMGLSFSVPVGTPIPRSLMNIYKELKQEFADFEIPNHGNLIPWARQGVLLLNATLTVTRGKANSHANQGWEIFTDDVIAALNEQTENLVFMLWGRPAQKKGLKIDRTKHLVLETSHPSPLSVARGFAGCGHFLKCNEYLVAKQKSPIDWRLPLFLDGSEEL
jgi:uracil-DNA glycosylase